MSERLFDLGNSPKKDLPELVRGLVIQAKVRSLFHHLQGMTEFLKDFKERPITHQTSLALYTFPPLSQPRPRFFPFRLAS
jgi:hypothetical protein